MSEDNSSDIAFATFAAASVSILSGATGYVVGGGEIKNENILIPKDVIGECVKKQSGSDLSAAYEAYTTCSGHFEITQKKGSKPSYEFVPDKVLPEVAPEVG